MPITEELKNAKKFESVGFSHEQAEVLAETIEEAQTNGLDNLKEFIRNEIGWLASKLDHKITIEINGLRGEISQVASKLDNKITTEINGLRSEISQVASKLDNKITSEINGVRSEINGLRGEISQIAGKLDLKITSETNSIRSEIKDLEVRMAVAQKDLLIKIFTIIVGTVGMAVTILKLFP